MAHLTDIINRVILVLFILSTPSMKIEHHVWALDAQDVPSEAMKVSTITEPTLCKDDELNHSNLIECNDHGCKASEAEPVWPTINQGDGRPKIIHVYSSKAGDRLVVEHSEDLNYVESYEERNFDINTTLQVENKPVQKIEGFGTTIDLNELGSMSPDFKRNILNELFSKDRLGLSILRVQILKEAIFNGSFADYIKDLGLSLPTKEQLKSESPAKLVIFVDDVMGSQEDLEALTVLETISYGQSLDLFAVVLNHENFILSELNMMRDVFSRNGVFVNAKAADPSDIYLALKESDIYNGLVLKWENWVPYDTMISFREVMNNNLLLTVSSDRLDATNEPGDWQNSQNYAVQILNHFKHTSNGFIDNPPMVNLFSESNFQDRPIYSLHQNDGLYFKGPLYYALGHFSRYIMPGSELLEASLDTQPNMFAAQFGAFRTPDKHIVVVVLNDNEHLLPFRVRLWNSKVVFKAELKPKSFNTIIIKS